MEKNSFIQLTQLGREGKNLEFKRSTPFEGDFKAKIVKSILAFSNVRNGGAIVLGVNQRDDGTFDFVGMSGQDLATYAEDEISSVAAEYADPYVRMMLDKADIDGRAFAIILVSEFDEFPTVCKRNGPCNLRRGAIYTRTNRIPESAEVPSQTEMREILEIAVDKGIRRYSERQSRLGLGVKMHPSISDADRFKEQTKDLE